jgi:hypothetical protein
VVGDGQGSIPQIDGALDQILGVGGTVEEREVGVTVQFGVAGHMGDYISNICSSDVGSSPNGARNSW